MIRERFSEIQVTNLPPMRVATYRAASRTPEDDAFKVLNQWAASVNLREPRRTFGFDVEVSQEQAAAGLRGYELWMVVSEGVWPSAPVTMLDFPGGRAAALTIEDPFEDPFEFIPAGWQRMGQWANQQRIHARELQCLEEIVVSEGHRNMILYLVLPEDDQT